VPYRIVTICFLAALVATHWIPSGDPIHRDTPPAADGAITFDLCDLTWHRSPSAALFTLAGFAAFLTLFGQGLRNRRAPVWASIALCAGWAGMLLDQRLWMSDCLLPRAGQVLALQTALVLTISGFHLRSLRPI
jgi:hypothetical protein